MHALSILRIALLLTVVIALSIGEATTSLDSIRPKVWDHELASGSRLPARTKGTIAKAINRQRNFCLDAYPSDTDKYRQSQWFNNSLPFRIYAHSGMDVVSDQVINGGRWAEDLLTDIFWALDYKVPGDSAPEQPIFVDAGSNFGWLTMNVASRGYRVVAVEAMKANAKMLRNSLCGAPAIMDRTVLLSLGLGNETQKCFMYSTSTNEGNGNAVCGVSREEVERVMQPGSAIRSEMTIHRLDSLLMGLDVKVLKIDVEGFEPGVMYGASQMLEAGQIKFACMEFFPELMQRNMRNPNATIEFIEWLVTLPYRVSILGFDRGYLSPEAARVALRGDRTRDDIFLAHKDLPITSLAAA